MLISKPTFKIKRFKCPHCDGRIEARVPTRALVTAKGYWDSAVVCPHCNKLLFKKVWPNGKIVASRM